MYNAVVTIWTIGGNTTKFPMSVTSHQGSSLSLYIFALVLD